MKPPTFPEKGLQLLRSLQRNNTTAWFSEHRDEYRETVQIPALAIVEYVNAELQTFAAAYMNTKKSPLSRPNRDTRFSKDKSPYRTDVGVVFPRGGMEKHECAGFFFRISPDGGELVAGAFMPGPDELRALRKYLAAKHQAFDKLVSGKALSGEWGNLQGEQLKRVPKPYDSTHPAEAHLRRTQLFFARSLPPSVVTSSKFADNVVRCFRSATPFVETLDAALGNA